MVTSTSLTPWHKVVRLREDVRNGDLSKAAFAADLYDVVMERGSKVYRDPYEFFALTYPTLNIRNLSKDIVWRLAGKSDKAIRQLELTYGGGKTHTLITLYHLTRDPEHLPDLPAVKEFTGHIDLPIPHTRIVVLPFDKFDPLRGMEIKGVDGDVRWLKYPWSVIAYQLAGDEGLRYLHADGLAEEREIPPAENLLEYLLSLPQKENKATLLLIDEVLMYVRNKVGEAPIWRTRLIDFFQYLTQAATKVSTCAIVASLLATDPLKSDTPGKELTQELYAIFRRQKEESIQPVEKNDVAEVLRRRFFTPESIKEKDLFSPHVVAAYQGMANLDDQTARDRYNVEQRLKASYPFHPGLTDVFYGKWTNLEGFQRTRGILLTFAMALQEAEKWDSSPLICTNIFIGDPKLSGLSAAARELTSVASHEAYEGKSYNWSTVLEGELSQARQIQAEHSGLKYREIEQAAFATFLHSQPLGAEASLRDLYLLVGPGKPDKIELDKALREWTHISWYLEEKNIQNAPTTSSGAKQLPEKWKLGPQPNLTQMHHDASSRISTGTIDAYLIEQIRACKSLTEGASITKADVFKLPNRPGIIEENTKFHYVILGPEAVSTANRPSDEAIRFITETTGPDKPRVYKNFMLIVVPSADGLEAARIEIRRYLGWLDIEHQFKGQDIEPSRLALLRENKNKSNQLVGQLVRHAYSIVITINIDGVIEAFRLQSNEGPLFDVIKNETQARIKQDPISAQALLPSGPYNIWREGDQSHRLNDLVNAFAKQPRLPKLLDIEPIKTTIFQGCKEGTFVLRISKTGTTFWRQVSPQDPTIVKDLEVVLPEYAELSEIVPDLLLPGKLPALWDENDRPLTLETLYRYFAGGHIATVLNKDYDYEQMYAIPKASQKVVQAAIKEAVKNKKLWLLAGASSLYGEEVPEEILTGDAMLQLPPSPLIIEQLLPEELPEVWQEGQTTADSIARALSAKLQQRLPWIIVKEVLTHAFAAEKLDRTIDSGKWPCDVAGAKAIKIILKQKDYSGISTSKTSDVSAHGSSGSKVAEEVQPLDGTQDKRVARAILDPMEVQNLGNKVTELKKLTIGKDLKIGIWIEFSSRDISTEKLEQIKELLKGIAPDLVLE